MGLGRCLALVLGLWLPMAGIEAAEGDWVYLRKGADGNFQERTLRLTPGTFLTVGGDGLLRTEAAGNFTASLGLSTVAATGNYGDLAGKPTLFSGSWNDLANKPALFSGNYSDLTGKPALFSGSWNDLADRPALFSGNYSDLAGKPALFSGSWNDLADKPVLFSGNYSDLTGKPALFSGNASDLVGAGRAPVRTVFTGDGLSKAFSPVQGYTDAVAKRYLVAVSGLLQDPGVDFTMSTNTINFTAAPPAGVKILILALP
jgi:hypothetical protein